MEGALISTTAKVALQQVASLAADEIRLLWGFKKNLKSLKETVDFMLAVVEDAEEKQVKDPAIGLWLKSLEALAFRAEHILDKVNYERLRRKVVEDPNWFRAKVSSFFSSHNQPYFFVKMVHKVDDLNTRFEVLGKKANKLGLQSRLGAISVADATLRLRAFNNNYASPLREKDSVLGLKVIGRETEASFIVNKLLEPSDEILTSIPIRGMGGLGKTTLAKLIYNDEKIVMYKKIWVGVPKNCDPVSIFRLILESLTKESAENLKGRDTIVQKIKGKLEDKRYLLVLDDVWSANKVLWDDILGCLRGISPLPGNWIIVTTRERDVAAIFATGSSILQLDKLSSEDCLKIVKEKALISGEQNQEFEAIREDIKNVCQGLPLVASIIGSLLRTNSSKNWNSLLQKGISNFTGDEYSHVMHILRLSFDNLPSPSVKKCFAYCSLFAKNSMMENKQLVQLWMAQGFLQRKSGDNDVEIGSECIKSLIGSSLFEEVINENGECLHVRMHDLVHDLAELISNPTKNLKDVKKEDHYLSIDSFGEEIDKLPKKLRMLRALFSRSGAPNASLMEIFKHLHVLQLSRVESHMLPSSISNLIHLRYLGVSKSRIRTFPESISRLYNLQTLRIVECFDFEALPKGMTKLINLRHLHFDYAESLPPKVGRLTSLQTLEHFVVSEENQIEDLGCLENLRCKLSIYNLERVISKEESLQAVLKKKPMNSLSFCWNAEAENCEEVLEGLEPHPHLEELKIVSYSGDQFPLWFLNMSVCIDHGLSQRLDRLVSLSIISCRRCSQLPGLGKLQFLKYLKLMYLDDIRYITPSFYGIDTASGQVPRKIFPALRQLHLHRMKNLKVWMDYEMENEIVEMFPKLEELEVIYCNQLRHAPIHFFQNVKHLKICETNLNRVLPDIGEIQMCSRYPLESLILNRCHNVSELPEYFYKFQSLRSLEMISCKGLKSFPFPMEQQGLTSLQKFQLKGCNQLTRLPHELLSYCASLTHIEIKYCDGLSKLPANLLDSCGSLHYLEISELKNLVYFPLDLQKTPALSSLNLSRLPKLMTAPRLKPLSSYTSRRLLELKIGGFSDSIPEVDWSELSCFSSSLRRLELISWPYMVSLPIQLQHLTALTELTLSKLGRVKALPDWFGRFVSLELLHIDNCEKLCYLPSAAAMRNLTKLSTLHIIDCPLLKERCTQRNDPNAEWAKISHIPKIWMDYRLLTPEDEVC